MPEKIDPPGSDCVQVAVSIVVVKPYAFRPGDRNEGPSFVLLHLGARMPHCFQTAFGQRFTFHCGTSIFRTIESLDGTAKGCAAKCAGIHEGGQRVRKVRKLHQVNGVHYACNRPNRSTKKAIILAGWAEN